MKTIKIVLTLILAILPIGATAEEESLFDTVIFSCSEPMPEVKTMFEEDLGRFVSVLNMGNIISLAGLQPDRVEIGSVEYAVEHGARRIIILGHKGCNIIKSVIENPRGRGNQIGIYPVISKSVTLAKSESSDPETILQRSIENNVRNTMRELQENRFILYDFVQAGTLKVEGAIYNPNTGKAEFLEVK
jgi:carbonic anhydrase